MGGGSLLGYVFSDLTFSVAVPATANNPGFLGAGDEPDMTVPLDVETVPLTITDDDTILDDDFQEGAGINQTVNEDVVLDDGTQLAAAGDVLEAEFFFTMQDPISGQQFNIYFGAFGANATGDDAGDLVLVFSEFELVPGVTYTFISATDGGGAPYANLVCFADGSMIATPRGPEAVETLEVGDLVETLDNGPQPIVWIGSRRLSGPDLARNPSMRPVRIAAGALGGGAPSKDLLVSPQHRILIRGARAEMLFGAFEALVPAQALIDDRSIRPVEMPEGVTYRHIMTPAHEILAANDAQCESLLAGGDALEALSDAQRAEIEALMEGRGAPYPARPLLRAFEGRAARV